MNEEVDKITSSKENQIVLKAENIFKTFTINVKNNPFLDEGLNFNKKHSQKITVLNGIDLNLIKGEMLGIVGRNGAGKSTLLKILSGIINPSSGTVKTVGKISPLIALGSGFHPELTAKENIMLYGQLLGETKKSMKQKIKQIIEFAELEQFVDEQLRHFSTGMVLRLAFSTALSIEPDILLVDEVTSVGDIKFQQKSSKEFLTFKRSGKSIILVSHNLEHLKKYCDRLIWLEEGNIVEKGNPDEVITKYIKFMTNSEG